jgi:SAM-dependent methyltransferase
MIEANNPEINVDELIGKIREEAAKRHSHSKSTTITNNNNGNNAATSKIMSNITYIEALLRNAESRAYVRTKWPDKLNRFPFNVNPKLQTIILNVINFVFKDQREVNLNLINSLKESVTLNRRLIEQITTLKAQMDECLVAVNSRLQSIDERSVAVNSRLQSIDERLGTVNTCFQGLDERLGEIDTRSQELDASFNTVDTLMQSWLTGIQEQLDTLNSRVQDTDERLGVVDIHIQGLDERLSNANTRLQQLDKRYITNDNYLKNDLIQQKRLITQFLEEARRRLPEPFNHEQLQTFVKEDTNLLDAFYTAFEDQFRGSRKEILNKLKVYLPLIEEANVGTSNSLILDVGCGRGEWLELLRESGYAARGIDINRVMLEQCRSRGLEVIESDVIAYLQSLPDTSLGAITGFHIIEHLPFKILVKLLDESLRVLKSGGFVIFETPNIRNILVGAGDFYRDPTHLSPIHPDTVRFVAESRGFINSESYFFEDKEGLFSLVRSSQIKFDTLSDYVNVSRDMVFIGYKP